MKIKAKFLLFILLPAILFFAATITYVAIKAHSITQKNAEELLVAHGTGLSYELESKMEKPLFAIEMIASTYEAFLNNGIVPEREHANLMLQELLKDNPNLIAAWMHWEKNAFDGKDDQYKNKRGHDATGRFIPYWFQDEHGNFSVTPLVGTEEDEFIQNTLDYIFSTKESILFEPYEYVVNGEMQLMTSIAVPVVVNDKVVGIVGADLLLSEIDERVSELTFYESGFAGLITNNGTVISHKDKELVGTNYFESKTMATHPDAERVIAAVKEGKNERIESFSNVLQTEVYHQFTPIRFGDIKAPWSAFLAAPKKEVMKEVNNLVLTIAIVSMIAAVLLALFILYITNTVTRSIGFATQDAQKMANGDFTSLPNDKDLARKDEIGIFARAFFEINKNMSELIGKVKESTQKVTEAAAAIDDGAKQSSQAASEVAASIAEVSSSAENQMQSAEESSRSIEEMSQGIQKNAEALSTLAEKSNEMGTQANLGKEAVQLAMEQMDLIQKETLETKTILNQLQEQASKIEGIVSIITDISEQTNLLALNAAIESARAGEAGKGFAVVADEVRKLADQTNSSALDIQKLIEVIQRQSEEVNRSMNANVDEVNKGIERIKEVENVFTKMLEHIEYVVKEVDELAAVMEEMAAISEEVTAASEQMASSAEVASGHSQQVAAAAEEQLATMEEMTKSTARLKEIANELNNLVAQFRV